jgi:hypothetical protein
MGRSVQSACLSASTAGIPSSSHRYSDVFWPAKLLPAAPDWKPRAARFFSSSTDSPAQNGGRQTLNTVSAPSSRTWPDVQTFARTVFQAGVFFSLNN